MSRSLLVSSCLSRPGKALPPAQQSSIHPSAPPHTLKGIKERRPLHDRHKSQCALQTDKGHQTTNRSVSQTCIALRHTTPMQHTTDNRHHKLMQTDGVIHPSIPL
mmetsp:Transcript_9291/g.26818  ORF Transcript_9291/g.26818 Transcript_9291/m.26818 type:complete len:105 (-) Transcript_9291:104-418(-)